MINKTKVLLADDDVMIVDILAKRLTLEGYEVVKAFDGQMAWEKIKTDSPDVIILDLTMPKKDGLEILKELREHPPSAKWQPVVIVSGRNELEDMKKGYTLEADHYLVKPCSVDDILKAIRLMIALIPQRKSSTDINNE